MTGPQFPPGWYPLMRAAALGERPVTRPLAGGMLRLVHVDEGVTAQDTASGRPWSVRVTGGWVFAALGDPPAEALPDTELLPTPFRVVHLASMVRAGLGDLAENILDTTHTSVVHQGYLRRPGARRRVEAIIASGEGWVSATYPPGAAPSGWGARLLGAQRYTITDTFRRPAIAEVTYADEGRAVFAARFRLTPAADGETYVAATLAVPGGSVFAAIKLAVLRLFFRRIFAEDRAVLEQIGANRAAHGGAPLIFTPPDVLRPAIDAILAGRSAPPSPARIALKV
jgi:phenylpropionate dioxygenase-like ring-hydroxylating dioxygenase large terminal subunit